MSGLTVASLRREIKRVEFLIVARKKKGVDCSFEEDLLKEWRKYLPGGRLHHKLTPNATKTTRGALPVK